MSYNPISDAELSGGSFWTETLARKVRDNIEAGGPPYTPGDYLIHENSAERSQITNTVYVKLKEIKINRDGAYRIKFDLKSPAYGYVIKGRVYKNGNAIGTERSTGETTYQTFTEDLSGFLKGDLIQIYGQSSSNLVYIANLQICCAEEGSLQGY